ncbi:hypothetical protein H6G20_19905 [Desertifilum sp. FACHB-1129]|uniref:Uncharacterized protein n=1 Tax=Desertifilum tharense IPPAS B-1220 TaxID=1781255 RepID=A0A1E5QJX1_9CYAN|nr:MULTISPECIES: type IV pilus biogenesis protein EbsA [Cyanophyceae]MCD8485612.1 hypothetical protein [Desertifilum sp.]MDA0210426.1 hypothetical protein [Cyanobacteria bacterium FC1]NES97726.1 hypothetical protein [Desertifilum sp. SIO1I2]MBD2313937.1 hypothetical protein [Desertifilum sp. FACHB-1129]MBD2324769.1 hypothetical protein [Desertifilum sp. FACHB-866]
MAIDQIKPADQRVVGVYAPYYQGGKRNLLPYAISLYQNASLEGQRKIEGGESIPFLATWYVSNLPADMTRCRLQFDGNAELSYEVMMANYEFVDFLIELLTNYRRHHTTDFSQAFYRKLLRLDE